MEAISYTEEIQVLKQRIEELEKKNELYEKIFAQLPLGIQVFDELGFSHLINKKQAELLGLPDLSTGVGTFNVLTDPYTLANGESKIYERVYAGENFEQTFQCDLGISENQWDTRKDCRIIHQRILPIKNRKEKVEYVLAIIEDVTEIKLAEQELKESEKNHRDFVNHSPDILYKFSNKRGALFWSDRVKDILGFSPSELTENPFLWYNSIHPDFKQKVDEALSDFEKGEKYSIDYPIKTKQGNWIWLHDYFMFKKHQGDEIIVEGHATDITERKITEKLIKESEIKFATIFNILDVGITITDELGNIIDCNRASERILGVSKEEHLTRNYAGKEWNIIRPDHSAMPPEEYASVRALREKREITNVEMGIVKPGGITWISVHATPLNLKGYGVAVSYIDITERKKGEQERLIFNRNFEAFLKQTSDFIYFKDVNSRFLFCSQTLAEITGHKHWKEMIGKHDFEVFPEDTAKVYMEEEIPIFHEGKPLINKINPYYTASGEKRFVQTNKWPLFGDDCQVIGIFGISRDITDRLKAEQIIKESEIQLKELNATKDKIFSIIAHDLRNPFNALIKMNELVSRRIDINDPASAKKILALIQNTSQQALSLLDNLLQWSHIQTGKLEFNPILLDLKELLEDIMELLKANYTEKNIRIKVTIEPYLQLRADKLMLETILRNLISNAIKFTRRDGTIEVIANNTKRGIEISVWDNGMGIPENIRDKIFHIDRNNTSLGTENEKGTGLGLLLCKEFVERHGGSIWVESKEGEGTRFTFTILCENGENGKERSKLDP